MIPEKGMTYRCRDGTIETLTDTFVGRNFGYIYDGVEDGNFVFTKCSGIEHKPHGKDLMTRIDPA